MLSNTLDITTKTNKSSPLRGAFISSGVMAFAGLGDALLYPVLPIYGKEIGFSVFWIGVLLSMNRFVRIVANTPIANIINRFGMRKIVFIASVLAVITTAVYGLSMGLIPFLLARLIWGVSYAGLKLATLNYAANTKMQGMAFGITQSIKSMGGLAVLWFGPLLIGYFGVENGILLVGLISFIGVILSLYLPAQEKTNGNQSKKVRNKITFYPSAINLLVFALSISIDGILVVVLAPIFGSADLPASELLIIVAFYLLIKRLFMAVISLLAGFFTLKISPVKLFIGAVVFCVIAFVLIALNKIVLGVLIAFLCNAVVVSFSPLVAMSIQKSESNLQAISSTSTWWDLGAAVGALTGVFLIEYFNTNLLFWGISFTNTALFINFIIHYAKSNKRFI